ncbi:MAG: site-specific DNA-methyltransferase [Rhodobacteraceae bacterium]|nr:site-specific DNA-methyltransferase [Paracoccaceae bacterium]
MKKPIVKVEKALPFLRSLKAGCAHAVVTDPPAGWGYQNREWDKDKKELKAQFERHLRSKFGITEQQARELMKLWMPPIWSLWFRQIAQAMLRPLVPGGWALVWTTPKHAHWTAMALELAGFQVQDQIAWIQGQGMPKNTNVSWLVDRELGAYRGSQQPPITSEAEAAAPFGTVLCPSREDFILARKPLDDTHARTWLKHRSGVLSVEDTRHSAEARWPKNTLLSPDVQTALGKMGRFFYAPKVRTGSPETEAGCEHLALTSGADMVLRKEGSAGLQNGRAGRGRSSAGARNDHPTVKPIGLGRFLIRQVTQPGQVVIDPFCGSGSFVVAGMVEGRRMVACDEDPHYVDITMGRARHFARNPPQPLGLRDPSGPLPESLRPAGNKITKVVVRLTPDINAAKDRWADPFSATARVALDHYFGIHRDPGGTFIPAGYMSGFKGDNTTSGAAKDLGLFADQAGVLRHLSVTAATVRTALRLWLGLCPHIGDATKSCPRDALREKESVL